MGHEVRDGESLVTTDTEPVEPRYDERGSIRLQLELMKTRVATGTEPQKTAFEALRSSTFGARDYAPHPRSVVECGPRSNPDLGCKDEQRDSEAAYAAALLWSISGNKAYAENAIKIMNAWSSTLSGGHINANGPVQAEIFVVRLAPV